MNREQREEIHEARQHIAWTHRPTVPALEEYMHRPLAVLDHGFVRLIDYMGDDSAIVQAARVSFGKGTKTPSDDRTLIRYLARHRHTTPFEMCEIKLHCKMPIFVARQWIRHRMASVNEQSARYSILEREFYIPQTEVLAQQSKTNRQGRGEPLCERDAERVIDLLRNEALSAYTTYEELLNDDGTGKPAQADQPQLARELARMNLSLNFYTQWYWKIDLHNLAGFLSLRKDKHAQYEIRVYAEVIAQLVEQWVPIAWEAIRDYRIEAVTLSRMEYAALQQLVDSNAPDLSGMSERERREFNERWTRSKP